MASRRDHPVEYKAPHVLSYVELRHWVRELMCNPAYGICTVYGGKAALARQMGVGRSELHAKLNGRWFFPSEQTRMTRVIMQVRRGEIRLTTKPPIHFSVCDSPSPPVPHHEQAIWQFQPGGRLMRKPDPVTQPALPTLRGAFERVKVRR